MRKGYLLVKCHRCNSSSEIKDHGVIPDILLCPICLEGEIERRNERPGNPKTAAESLELVPVLVRQ